MDVKDRENFRLKLWDRVVACLPLGDTYVEPIASADGVGVSAVSPDDVLPLDPGTDTMIDLNTIRAYRWLLVDLHGCRVLAKLKDIYAAAAKTRPVILGRGGVRVYPLST